MKKKLLLLFVVLFTLQTNAQTVTALQQQNARATGYAIVAARNPGKSFSVFMIKWDGTHDLEYNANTQINPSWHAQAAVKGNYFNQAFDGTDFTIYSSVIVSQAEFDNNKNAGYDWWIVCSTLPAFSNSGLTSADNGNIGIGTTTPAALLDLQKLYGNDVGIKLSQPGSSIWDIKNTASTGLFTIGAGGGTYFNIVKTGNVGIGTTDPKNKLSVNGIIWAKEVKVSLTDAADWVFEKNYKLKPLAEVEKYINENKHLPEVPSAEEFRQNDMNVSQMSNKLLQKVEELTLYAIEQKKEIDELKAQVKALISKKQ